MLERRFIEQDTVSSKVTFVAEEYTMKVADYVVRTTGDESFDLHLPPVQEAAGRFYSLHHRGSGTVTVKDQDDSENWSDLSATAANDNVILYSDGMKWATLASVLT